VAEIPRHRLEALAVSLSCHDYRLEIGRVAGRLELSEQHTRLQLRRLRELDEKLGYPSWAVTDSRWLGLRLLIVVLGRREGPPRQLSTMFEPGHVPWWLRVHWLPLPYYLAMLAEFYGGAYMLVYRLPRRFMGRVLDYFEDNREQLGVKTIMATEQVPVRNCSGVLASDAAAITKTYLAHSRSFERAAKARQPPRLTGRNRLLDVALYTVLEARPLARYADLDRVDVVAFSRGYPPPRSMRMKTRLVQRHYNSLSASEHLGRAWLGTLLYRGQDPAMVAVSVPRDCSEVLYAAVAATLASPYIALSSDQALTVTYAPPRLQKEISSFIASHCGGEAETAVVTRYVAAPMPVEMYNPEEKAWGTTPLNPVETLRRYGLLQPLRAR